MFVLHAHAVLELLALSLLKNIVIATDEAHLKSY
jgi:hypothetical protein